MKINKYPDGSSYITADSSDEKTIFRLNSYEDLWHLRQFVDVMNDIGYVPTVTIPNLIDAQADRRFNRGESNGLKLVCNFLNEMNANFRIFHPHNSEVVEALIDNVEIIDNSEFVKTILDKHLGDINKYFEDDILEDNLILMSSDAGGFKPLMKLCNQISWQGETLSASKSREWNGSESKLIQILPLFDLNKDILIVDDISVYGGTFKGLSTAIKNIGHKGKLYLAVSHMTVQELGDDPVTNYFDKVFTTNSKFDKYTIPDGHTKGVCYLKPKNLEIIELF